MLGDVEPYRHWLNREHPSERAQETAATYIQELSESPWAYPSEPIDLSDQPRSEERFVSLSVMGEAHLQIHYRYYYAGPVVDLLDLTQFGTQK